MSQLNLAQVCLNGSCLVLRDHLMTFRIVWRISFKLTVHQIARQPIAINVIQQSIRNKRPLTQFKDHIDKNVDVSLCYLQYLWYKFQDIRSVFDNVANQCDVTLKIFGSLCCTQLYADYTEIILDEWLRLTNILTS